MFVTKARVNAIIIIDKSLSTVSSLLPLGIHVDGNESEENKRMCSWTQKLLPATMN